MPKRLTQQQRMWRYKVRKAARPAELRHDKPSADDNRCYIHVLRQDGMQGWAYFEVAENGMLMHRYHTNAEFAEAFDRKDIETYCELTRFAFMDARVLAVKADSKQLIPDNLLQIININKGTGSAG